MAGIEFDAQIANGSIEIPAQHRDELAGPVHVIVFPRVYQAGPSKIDELLAHPLEVPGFRPLTRDEANERRG